MGGLFLKPYVTLDIRVIESSLVVFGTMVKYLVAKYSQLLKLVFLFVCLRAREQHITG